MPDYFSSPQIYVLIPESVSVRVSIEGQKAKKHPTTAECFFLFVEKSERKWNRKY